ncbi:hypothetical protein Pla8534_63910 [Lignipirellula cremea]|uniref:Uncharacterized protein n=1 Tax=Lignipirellula cremea TaxID=2528010 RepID=A0A518E376_9BACT|nr:hypothetical protein Pla8534_63910 [Lignipirellula cremea]
MRHQLNLALRILFAPSASLTSCEPVSVSSSQATRPAPPRTERRPSHSRFARYGRHSEAPTAAWPAIQSPDAEAFTNDLFRRNVEEACSEATESFPRYL